MDIPEFTQISILGAMQRCMKSGDLQARAGLYIVCTETRFTFLGSSTPYLPFDMNIALVQTWYHGDR